MVEPAALDAINALRSRGIGNAEELLKHATAAEILSACRRWDARTGVGPGLLAHWIRERQFIEEQPQPTENRSEQLRRRYDQYAAVYPPGSTTESHAQLQRRREYDDDPCPGELVVQATSAYPNLVVRCDECDYEAGYTPKALTALRLLQPVASEDLF